MPVLRWAHADHRNLPARTETDVTRATSGAGRMTYRRSTVITPSWLQSAGPAQNNYADQPLQKLNTIVPSRKIGLSDRKGCDLHGFCPMKNAIQPRQSCRRISRQRTFPIASPRPPRLPPWEIFQRGPRPVTADTSRHGPHRKIFTRADLGHTAGVLRSQPAYRSFAAVAKIRNL